MRHTAQTDIKLTLYQAKLLAKQYGCTLRHDTDWQEYVVRWPLASTFHTDCIEDAYYTMRAEYDRQKARRAA